MSDPGSWGIPAQSEKVFDVGASAPGHGGDQPVPSGVAVARRLTGPAILTRAEAAQALGVHPATVARWAAAGTLLSFRTPSGERRYHRCDVEALLNRRGLADSAPSPEPVHEPTEAELTDEHSLLDLSRRAALNPPASSGEDHECCPARPARAAG